MVKLSQGILLLALFVSTLAFGQDDRETRRRSRHRPIKEKEILHLKTIQPIERSEETTRGFGPADSLKWWDERNEGFRRWVAERKKYPRAKSLELETLLVDLATEIREIVGVPAPRLNVFIADTLNPSVWPLGGGFLFLSAGLLHRISEEREFTFLMSLELAHEALRHRLWPAQNEILRIRNERERARLAAIEKARLEKEKADKEDPLKDPKEEKVIVQENLPQIAIPSNFWAVFVQNDPLDEFNLQYEIQEEVDALALVSRVFERRGWNFRATGKNVVTILKSVSTEVSSIRYLHEHLDKALSQPVWRKKPAVPVEPNPRLATANSFQKLQMELRETSINSLQHNPWLLQIVANYNPEEFSALKDDSDVFASLYLHIQTALMREDWNEIVAKADQALEKAPKSEPFLWHKGIARLQLEKFGMCQTENWDAWVSFDYLREVLFMECLFLDGRYSDSQIQAVEHRRKYPLDIRGAYWDVLSQIRMRLNVERRLEQMELFWGQRPAVLALRVLDFMYRGKREELEKVFREFPANSSKFSAYETEEIGMYDFARAWASHQMGYAKGDSAIGKLEADLRGAEGRWAIARLVRINLPRLMN